jgi:hypothetical protein
VNPSEAVGEFEPQVAGTKIFGAAWISLGALVVVAVPFALGADSFEKPVAAVGLASFAIGIVVWVVAFAQALARTANGDDVAVSNWVFLAGSAPAIARRNLLGVAALTLIVTLATTAANPFVWLANLLPLALSALWSARHGTFPSRKVSPRSARGAPRGRPGK